MPQAGVLPPHVPAPGAPVATDRHLQHGGTPAQRLVRQPPHDGVAWEALAAAAATPLIGLDHTAGQHGAIRLESLPRHHQPEPIEASEGGQGRGSEGSVRHVEVFQMGSVRTPIIGRPRPLLRHRRADHLYTLDCDEPL